MEVEHISLATKADLFLVVPATANIIGKISWGIADDMLSTTTNQDEESIEKRKKNETKILRYACV